jgi:hypothetical protein
MILAARDLFEAPHGKKRDKSQGGSDENFEELRVAIDDDHPSKSGSGAPGQDPGRGQRRRQGSKNRAHGGHGRFLSPARYENERQGHAGQNQFRDE